MGLTPAFQSSEAEIISHKKEGVVYVADFQEGVGKYVSITESEIPDPGDLNIKISPRISIRVTYLTNSETITGVELAKVTGPKIEKLHFSTLGFKRILELLSLFSELDLKSITNKAVVLDESIIGNNTEVSKFLTLIATDPEGKEKISEVAKNYGLIKIGDIDEVVNRRDAVQTLETILNSQEEFNKYKADLGVGKNEEVWQRFFSKNSWILGSDFVEVLDERRLDVENITDYLLKSYDGFVDIVELKLPTEDFWTSENIPRSELTAATMQCNRYILQTERKINDLEFNKKIQHTPIVKPRITLIYGRSQDWSIEQNESYRVLNSSYSNLNIISYDHILERAKRLVGLNSVSIEQLEEEEKVNPEDIPF